MPTTANEKLIHAYLEIVTTGDYENFGTLLTDDCTFSLMPSGHTFRSHNAVAFSFSLLSPFTLCDGSVMNTPDRVKSL